MHELPEHRLFCTCHYCMKARIEAHKKKIGVAKPLLPKVAKSERFVRPVYPMKPQGPKPYPAVPDGELLPSPESHPHIF